VRDRSTTVVPDEITALASWSRSFGWATILLALLVVFGATAARCAVVSERDTVNRATDGTAPELEHDIPAGAVTVSKGDRYTSGECLPGTIYCVEYLLAVEDTRYHIGDRLQVTCMPLVDGRSSKTCDSIRIVATLGQDQIPIGIEWALLSPADLAEPISTRRELLDRRLTRCGGDNRGVHFVRVRVDDCDTTGRAHPRSQKLETALQHHLTDDEGGSEDMHALREALARKKESVLVRVLYAGALRARGQCEEYYDQCMEFYRRGYSDRPVRDLEIERCRLQFGPRR